MLCKGIARERYSRTRSYYGIVFSSRTTRTSTTVRIRYRNPSPPPEERLVAFVTRGTSAEFQLKSGDHVSITLKKKRRRLHVINVTSHVLEMTWRVKTEGLSEQAFDHLGI